MLCVHIMISHIARLSRFAQVSPDYIFNYIYECVCMCVCVRVCANVCVNNISNSR